ncbi:MAG: hypothetical protein PHP25_00930 [Candidatus Moranbacteria bacterium]|nr:hypothetical protein [Candidatus Moranbacteria bacterium]
MTREKNPKKIIDRIKRIFQSNETGMGAVTVLAILFSVGKKWGLAIFHLLLVRIDDDSSERY